MESYIHGYSVRESSRLNDQAETLDTILHHDTLFGKNEVILEAGCGVGAQTKIIAPKNPRAHFVSVDISPDSIIRASKTIEALNILNVQFKVADIFSLPFEDEAFDHVFVCFVLEHLSNPIQALQELKRVLKKNGTITVIEGDHGSTYFYPECEESKKAIECQVQLQKRSGGNALIGRQLFPLLDGAGFNEIHVSPRMVYVDGSKPNLIEGFTKNTFTAMIEGIEQEAVSNGLMDEKAFKKGIKGLYRTTHPDGVFCYTFFKAKAIKR
jgi:SAM-dependent methyltransferase